MKINFIFVGSNSFERSVNYNHCSYFSHHRANKFAPT